MNRELRFADEIFCDLQEIACYLQRQDARLSPRFRVGYTQTCQWIARNPFAGRVRKGLRPEGLRGRAVFGFPRHFIFYLVDDDSVIILRVLHGSRDLTQVFND